MIPFAMASLNFKAISILPKVSAYRILAWLPTTKLLESASFIHFKLSSYC